MASPPIVALEIGTSNVVALVGEQREGGSEPERERAARGERSDEPDAGGTEHGHTDGHLGGEVGGQRRSVQKPTQTHRRERAHAPVEHPEREADEESEAEAREEHPRGV